MFALIQYDDRPLNEFQPLVNKNKEYAKKYGIEYIFLSSGWDNYPPWWRKVLMIHELLPKYEAILWVDSDAAIVGHQHFKELFNGKHFVLSPNPPMLNWQSLSMFTAPFCAGIWGVKNTPEGMVLMKQWISNYDKTLWKKEGQVWKHTKGLYAGFAYEQGSFESNIWRSTDFEHLIENKPHRIMNYLPLADHLIRGKHCPSDVFAVHYWKGNRGHIYQHWIT